MIILVLNNSRKKFISLNCVLFHIHITKKETKILFGLITSARNSGILKHPSSIEIVSSDFEIILGLIIAIGLYFS